MPRDPGSGLTEHIVGLPDGRRLRTIRAGDGPGPLVVFEAGMSAPAATWIHTQRELSAYCRTLSYDRAGYGGSDVDPQERTLERIVDDLVALLNVVAETAPVLLVGHSWGGPIIRLFADRYPERVAGLVFVDSSYAEVFVPSVVRVTRRSFRVMGWLLRLGGRRLVERYTLAGRMSAEVTASDVAIMMRDYATLRGMRTAGREGAQIIPSLPLINRLQAKGTPDVPAVYVQGGRVDRGNAAVRELLNRTAADLAARATYGELVIVEEAGHLVPQEAPAVLHKVLVRVVDKK